MQKTPFDRNKHVYHNEEFVELIKDAIRFSMEHPFTNYHCKTDFLGLGYMRFITQERMKFISAIET